MRTPARLLTTIAVAAAAVTLAGCNTTSSTTGAGSGHTGRHVGDATATSASLVLGPDGLGSLKLGMSLGDAMATGMFKTPAKAGAGESCGFGAMTADRNASVWISDKLGVAAIGAYGDIATPQGIKIGSSYADLHAAYPDWNPQGTGDITNGHSWAACRAIPTPATGSRSRTARLTRSHCSSPTRTATSSAQQRVVAATVSPVALSRITTSAMDDLYAYRSSIAVTGDAGQLQVLERAGHLRRGHGGSVGCDHTAIRARHLGTRNRGGLHPESTQHSGDGGHRRHGRGHSRERVADGSAAGDRTYLHLTRALHGAHHADEVAGIGVQRRGLVPPMRGTLRQPGGDGLEQRRFGAGRRDEGERAGVSRRRTRTGVTGSFRSWRSRRRR